MRLKEIKISNWKSFPFDENPEPISFNENLNIFIGPNSSGKTNLANAIRISCGYGPDYGGDKEVNRSKNIRNSDLNGLEKFACVQFETFGKESQSVNIDASGSLDFSNPNLEVESRRSFFPIGDKKELFKLTTVRDQRLLESNVWNELWTQNISSIMKEYFHIEVQRQPPNPYEANLFSDLFDENSQRLYESGKGIASLLYLIIEIVTHKKLGVTCFLFEEPELSMHPLLLRKFVHYLAQDKDTQYFITTHSSIFINETLKADGDIFQLRKIGGYSSVLKITFDNAAIRDLVYEQLGSTPGDILLANTVIWVEGPSDVIYLKYWIQKIAPELSEDAYTFMFYGGSCISHVSFEDIDLDHLIELCNISSNSIIVIDQDKDNETDELKVNAKIVIRNFQENKKLAWVTGGREVENYIHPKVLKQAVKEAHPNSAIFAINEGQFDRSVSFNSNHNLDKVNTAKKVVGIYQASNDVDPLERWGLEEKLKEVVKRIKQANE